MKTYLKVPYAEKDKAKALGARFDMSEKLWYCPDGVDLMKFKRWLPSSFGKWDDRRTKANAGGNLKRTYAAVGRSEGIVKKNIDGAMSVLRNAGYIVGKDYVAPDHDCPTPPWEDCQCEGPLPEEQRAHLMDILHGR